MINEDMFRQMDRDDLVDKAFFYKVMPVREFARLMQVAPQLVYYRIRNHKMTTHTCGECGREGLVDVIAGAGTFRNAPKDVQAQIEAYREHLESGSTEDEPGDDV